MNIQGKVIYGYTWDVKKLNEGAGIYRLSFSFETGANTIFDSSTTSDGMYDPNGPQVTYVDVTIAQRIAGGGKKDRPVKDEKPSQPKSDASKEAVNDVFSDDKKVKDENPGHSKSDASVQAVDEVFASDKKVKVK